VNAGDFRTRWAPRVGDRAASLYPVVRWSLGLGGIGVGLWALVLYVAVRVDVAWVWAFTYALLAADLVLLAVGGVSSIRMARAMSDFLGMRIPFWRVPALREREWSAWCRRNGVAPR